MLGMQCDGELGDGTKAQSLSPVQVVGLEAGVTAMATGLMHLRRGWGRNGPQRDAPGLAGSSGICGVVGMAPFHMRLTSRVT